MNAILRKRISSVIAMSSICTLTGCGLLTSVLTPQSKSKIDSGVQASVPPTVTVAPGSQSNSSSSSQSGIDTNTQPRYSSNPLALNREPEQFSLNPNETKRWNFDAIEGRDYEIISTASKGATHIYMSNDPGIDSEHYQDSGAFGTIKFRSPKTEIQYIAIQDNDNSGGSEGTVRLVSPQGPLVTNTVGVSGIQVNSSPTTFSLVPKELKRWRFYVKQGETYTISTTTSNGSINFYAGKMSSVDSGVFDYSDTFGRIEFRAGEDGSIFIAIQDNDNSKGSDGTVRVISYDAPHSASSTNITTDTLTTTLKSTNKFNLINNSIKRWNFAAKRGYTYAITSTVLTGSIGMYLSRLASVDRDVNDQSASFSTIELRAEKNETLYVAVQDNGNTKGSTGQIELTEEKPQ